MDSTELKEAFHALFYHVYVSKQTKNNKKLRVKVFNISPQLRALSVFILIITDRVYIFKYYTVCTYVP